MKLFIYGESTQTSYLWIIFAAQNKVRYCQWFWRRVMPYGKDSMNVAPCRQQQLCSSPWLWRDPAFVPPPGHDSLNLPSLLHHILAIAVMAFTSPLPTGQSDRQVCNDCRIRFTPVTSASSRWLLLSLRFGLFPQNWYHRISEETVRVSKVESPWGECSGLMQSNLRGSRQRG